MNCFTVIESSEEQIEKIYQKHLKWPRVATSKYVEIEGSGFVTCWSLSGKKWNFN